METKTRNFKITNPVFYSMTQDGLIFYWLASIKITIFNIETPLFSLWDI